MLKEKDLHHQKNSELLLLAVIMMKWDGILQRMQGRWRLEPAKREAANGPGDMEREVVVMGTVWKTIIALSSLKTLTIPPYLMMNA